MTKVPPKVVSPLTLLCDAGVKFGLEKTPYRTLKTKDRRRTNGRRPGSRSKLRGLEAEKP